MKFTKKFVLIPQSVYDTQQNQLLTSTVNKLDHSVEDIFNDPNCPDDIKYLRYMQLYKREKTMEDEEFRRERPRKVVFDDQTQAPVVNPQTAPAPVPVASNLIPANLQQQTLANQPPAPHYSQNQVPKPGTPIANAPITLENLKNIYKTKLMSHDLHEKVDHLLTHLFTHGSTRDNKFILGSLQLTITELARLIEYVLYDGANNAAIESKPRGLKQFLQFLQITNYETVDNKSNIQKTRTPNQKTNFDVNEEKFSTPMVDTPLKHTSRRLQAVPTTDRALRSQGLKEGLKTETQTRNSVRGRGRSHSMRGNGLGRFSDSCTNRRFCVKHWNLY